MDETAVFELFVRKLPATRGFLLNAGLESVLTFLEQFHCTADDLAYLSASRRYSTDSSTTSGVCASPATLYCLPEGTVFFEDEP